MAPIHKDITQRYMKLLGQDGTMANNCEKFPTRLAHLMWMLVEIEGGSMPDDKANRWLGYVQGVMHCRGYIKVNEERDFTRPYFTKKE